MDSKNIDIIFVLLIKIQTSKTNIMSVYKEGYYILNEIEKKSVQIYPDACDYGMPVKLKDENSIMVKQLVEMYGNELTRKVNRYSTGRSVDIDIELIDEWNTRQQQNFRLSFVSCSDGRCKGFDGYITAYKIN